MNALDKVEELLGVNVAERLFEASVAALDCNPQVIYSFPYKYGQDETIRPKKDEISELARKYSLDEESFILHMEWFLGFRENYKGGSFYSHNFGVTSKEYYDVQNKFLELYDKRYKRLTR